MQNSQHWDALNLFQVVNNIYQKNHCRTVSIETVFLLLKGIKYANQKNHCRTVSIETNCCHNNMWLLIIRKTIAEQSALRQEFQFHQCFVLRSEKPLQNSQHWDIQITRFWPTTWHQKNHCRTVSIETKTVSPIPSRMPYQKNHCRTVSIETYINIANFKLWKSEKPLQNSQHWDKYIFKLLNNPVIRKTIAEQSALRQKPLVILFLFYLSEKPLQNSQHWDNNKNLM